MTANDRNGRSAPAPRIAWSPGEYVAGCVIGLLVATVAVVWAATQLAAVAVTGHPAAFSVTAATDTTLRWLLAPNDPIAALPTALPASGVTATVWWSAFAVVTSSAIAAASWATIRLAPAAAPSAAWARPRHLRRLHVAAAGSGRLLLGRHGRQLVAAEPAQATIVLGPARSGKTAGLAIPAILEWDGTVLATSVRTDLLAATYHGRRRRGPVWVYDPTGSIPHTYRPVGWNPLDGCNDWQGAQRRATALCSAGRRGLGAAGDEDFWYAVAAKLLSPLLYAAAHGGYTMADVVRWVDTQEELEVRAELVAADEPAALHAAQATWGREERTHSSAYTTAEVVLHALQDPDVVASTTDATITADGLLDGTAHTLFVCAPSHEQDRLRPMFTALLEHIIERAYARHAADDSPAKPLLIVLDEAANIATPHDLDTIASTAAGTGIQLLTIWQDIAQIQARYGQRAATVVNNHRAKLVLSGVSDEPTLRYASQLVGDHEYHPQHLSTDSSGRHSTSTGQPQYRALAPADALRRIPTGHAVLIYGHLPPARIRLRPWYGDRRLTRLAEGATS